MEEEDRMQKRLLGGARATGCLTLVLHGALEEMSASAQAANKLEKIWVGADQHVAYLGRHRTGTGTWKVSLVVSHHEFVSSWA